MNSNLFIIAKSGWKYIGYALLSFILFSLIDFEFFASISFVTILLFLFLFRNPEREYLASHENSIILSPVDGHIRTIEEIEDDSYTYKIEIESSYLNVPVLRVPMNAELESIQSVRGSRLSKKSQLFSLLNEYAEIVLKDEEGKYKVKIVHRLKQSFASLDIDLVMKQKVVAGARYGVALNGISTVYLPKELNLCVVLGQKLTASETLLATAN